MRLITSSILVIIIISLNIATLSCAQAQSRRLAHDALINELRPVAEDKSTAQGNNTPDGIAAISYSQVFKDGTTEYHLVDQHTRADIPSIPNGYTIFNGLTYDIETKAIISGLNLVIFTLPSAQEMTTFSKLRVLHLEADELSPSGWAWVDRTALPGNLDRRYAPLISESRYERAVPNFTAKTIGALVDKLGLFVIATLDETPQTPAPFTNIVIDADGSPNPVKGDGELTYTVKVINNGPKEAGEVDLQGELDMDIEYLSASTSHGECRRSERSDSRVLCNLGRLPTGESATISITGRIKYNSLLDKKTSARRSLMQVSFKEQANDPENYINALQKEIITTVLPRP